MFWPVFGRIKHVSMCRCLGRVPATLGAEGCTTLDAVEISRCVWVNICTYRDALYRLLWEFVEEAGHQGDITAIRSFGRSGYLDVLLLQIGQSLCRLRLMAFDEPALCEIEVDTHKRRRGTNLGLDVCWRRECRKESKIHSKVVDPMTITGDVFVWWAAAHILINFGTMIVSQRLARSQGCAIGIMKHCSNLTSNLNNKK